jgi:hypothetical protein
VSVAIDPEAFLLDEPAFPPETETPEFELSDFQWEGSEGEPTPGPPGGTWRGPDPGRTWRTEPAE